MKSTFLKIVLTLLVGISTVGVITFSSGAQAGCRLDCI
ncbi:hypothetical protein SAMN05446635_0055 [Burkholderia sp. OK233]|nr:hypothetical protein SAMN05446635_0055 [Burkholderia sp. OK233]